MLERIRNGSGAGSERGFTTIEVLVVTFLIGILLAIAVPSYIGYRERAANSQTKSNLKSALPAAQVYFADKRTYRGMNYVTLDAVDPRISQTLTVASTSKSSFCLTDTVGGRTWSVKGPDPSHSDFYANDDCT